MKYSVEVTVVRDENLPGKIPPNVNVRSLQEVEVESQDNEIYVRFKRYIGLHPSGKTPWAVMRRVSTHHTVFGYYRTLAEAVRAAAALKKTADTE